MRRPGARLHAIAARLCGRQTMERLVGPTIADLQVEYENAVAEGRRWERRRIWIVGHLALIRVMAVHGGLRTIGMLSEWTCDERGVVLRSIVTAVAIMIAGTLVFAMYTVGYLVSLSDRGRMELLVYLVPHTLPLSIPIGVTFGILWGIGRGSSSRRSRAVVLSLALMASVASFVMLAWIVPTANQAFRVSMAGRPISKGANELTLGELRGLLEASAAQQPQISLRPDARSLSLNYHRRWALASAPFVLACFAVALTRRRHRRILLLLAGCLAIVGYSVAMDSARGLAVDGTLSAFAAAWAPNIMFLIMSLAILAISSQRLNRTVQART